MASYNRIVMIGNLTKDPDYKQLSSGQAVCRLGLASNRQYKNKQTGAMVQEVCFVDIDVFGPQAESCRQYLQKGRPVLIEGRLKFDMWQAPDGQNRNKHSIVADRVVFLGTGNGGAEGEVAVTGDSDVASQLANEFGLAGRPANGRKNSAAESSSLPAGEISFKDEPPFQDDLPF